MQRREGESVSEFRSRKQRVKERQAAKEKANTQQKSSSMTTTKSQGQIKAPSWYRNSDGSTPSVMQEGMTKEKWQKSQADTQARQERMRSIEAAKAARPLSPEERNAQYRANKERWCSYMLRSSDSPRWLQRMTSLKQISRTCGDEFVTPGS